MLPGVLLEVERRRQNIELHRQRRLIRGNSQPFNLLDKRFIELFRLNKDIAHHLIHDLEPYLNIPIARHGVSIEIAVLTALRFYATGSYQRGVGQDFNLGISQTTVHRCIHNVTRAIDLHLSQQYIKFPTTQEERQDIKVRFMETWHMPGVVGAIDCTHIAILKPRVEEHNFINRKGYHSLIVQAVCTPELLITHLNANFGGSTHDAFIWRNSGLQRYMQMIHEHGEPNTWLIGDSGYPLQPYLLTPIANPQPHTPEAEYNTAHKSARSTIERTFGLLKMRFRCILKERVARYDPIFVASLVTVCVTLHNICIRNNIELIVDDDEPPPQEDDFEAVRVDNIYNDMNLLRQGQQTRENVINRYFR